MSGSKVEVGVKGRGQRSGSGSRRLQQIPMQYQPRGLNVRVKGQGQRSRSKVEVKGRGQRSGSKGGVRVKALTVDPHAVSSNFTRGGIPRNSGFYPQPPMSTDREQKNGCQSW